MKKMRILSALLALVLTASSLAGCALFKTKTPEESEAEEPAYTITRETLSKYAIVVPEGCDDATSGIAEQLKNAINEVTDVEPRVKTDLVIEDSDTYYEEEYEILLGYVDREEISDVYSDVRENDSGYAVVGKKVLIIGRNSTALRGSYNAFFKDVLYKADSKDIFLTEGESKITAAEYTYNEMTVNGVNINKYKIIFPAVSTLNEKLVANAMATYVKSKTGYTLVCESDKAEPAAYEIQIGVTNRITSDMLSARDASGFSDGMAHIAPTDNGVWISGKTAQTLGSAAANFYEMLKINGSTASLNLTNGVNHKMNSISISAMTYNVYHKFTSERNPDHVLLSIEEQNADIFGCNEANAEWMSRLTAKFNSTYTCVKGKDSKSNTTGDYCPIFFKAEKLELIESGTKWLSDTPDKASKYEESHTQRIITYAILKDKATGVCFMYIQAHLENNESGYSSATARRKQSAVLKEFTDDYSYMPIIIGGDCNTTNISDLSPLLSGTRFSNSSAIAGDKKESGTWVGSSFSDISGGVLDYFFVTRDCITVSKYEAVDNKIDGKYPSDHIPVRIDTVIYQ